MAEEEEIISVNIINISEPWLSDPKHQSLVPPQKQFRELDTLTQTQQQIWRDLRAGFAFKSAPSRRTQIGLAVERLNINLPKEIRFSHETIAQLFGIPRSVLERQFKKYKNGAKFIGAPSIISPEETIRIEEWLYEQYTEKEYPTLEMINDYVSVVLKKEMNPNTLRKFLKEKLQSYKFIEAIPLEDVRFDVKGEDIDAYYQILEEKIAQADFRFFLT